MSVCISRRMMHQPCISKQASRASFTCLWFPASKSQATRMPRTHMQWLVGEGKRRGNSANAASNLVCVFYLRQKTLNTIRAAFSEKHTARLLCDDDRSRGSHTVYP